MRGARAHLAGREGLLSRERPGVDIAVVPGLLLLIARDLALYDPPRVLAWRLSHDGALASLAARLGPLAPAASGALDRDPLALLLAGLAVLLALGYALQVVAGARARLRAATIGLAALLLVVLPSLALVTLGTVSDRPYGQDGGVVQVPLAIDKLLAGETPYGADYSDSMLAKQARASSFWAAWGGNPILRHHAYLPGTHLLLLPFQVASRATLGSFDPRLATLLFYALTALLAARLPRETDARLAAAAVAALNPLVYWHQIFGANDLVFVSLLLAVGLLARASRPAVAGAVLGLACATKQLAWPFAPFLLLAMSGAHGFRDLLRAPTWRRLAGPLAACGLVFAAVVLPVVALDPRAFWGDIFAYNAGLPGADNYPLGGTPGFGFANFLIYFGRVASLRDYFPFSVFYLLLVPLGLLLVRAQLRDNGIERALVGGSAALLATLYFSRVVHPNYLIPAAVLLPLPVLAWRRRVDLALVPLLLLAVAVETTENGLLRAAWEQAAAAGLPQRLGGFAAALRPRAGESLTSDPFGLLLGAVAAGLGVLYLALGAVGNPIAAPAAAAALTPARAPRSWGPAWRAAFVIAAALVVVGVPTKALVVLGERTGLTRAQDPVVVQAHADAGRLLAMRSPYSAPVEAEPKGRQAYSASFRLDPPLELLPERPLFPPGVAFVAAAARLAGRRDLRIPALLALAGLALVVSLTLRPPAPILALALLAPPIAIGTALGSPSVLALGALLALWAAVRRGGPWVAGALGALAAWLDLRAALAALPLLLAARASSEAAAGSGGRRALAVACGVLGCLLVPVALLDPAAFLGRLIQDPAVGPGLGFFNLLAYRGAEATPLAAGLAPAAPVLGLLLTGGLIRLRASALAAAGVASLIGIVLSPALSPEAIALPLVLLALASAEAALESPAAL